MKLASGLGLGLVTFLLGAVVACSSDEEATPDASSSGGGTSSSSSGESSSGGGSSGTGSSSSSSGGGSSGTGSSSGAVDAGLQAVVTDVVLTQDAPCTLDLTVPGVDTPSDAADAKILAAIPREVGSYCDAGETMSYDGGYEVKANEWGVLSMALSQSVLYEGTRPTHYVLGHNFDIATGDELALEAVLDAAGIAKLRAACITKLTAEDYDAEQAGQACDSSIESFEGEGGGNIQIEKTGLRLYLDLPNGAFVIALEGAFVTWAELGTSVTLPLVQNFVSKQ